MFLRSLRPTPAFVAADRPRHPLSIPLPSRRFHFLVLPVPTSHLSVSVVHPSQKLLFLLPSLVVCPRILSCIRLEQYLLPGCCSGSPSSGPLPSLTFFLPRGFTLPFGDTELVTHVLQALWGDSHVACRA